MVATPKNLTESTVISASGFGAFPSIAPGTWIEIYASGLASSTRPWLASDFADGKAPTSLDGVGVKVGGQDAFIAYISPGQVNANVPFNVGLGLQQVTVTNGAETAAEFTVNVNTTQPGLLALPQFKIGGKQYVVAAIGGGTTYATPSGAIPRAASRPTRPGETIVIYGIGFGPATPMGGPGEIVAQINALDLPIEFRFGQVTATHSYAGLAPSSVGLYQFNVIVPDGVSGDAVPLSFVLNGSEGEQTLFIAVHE